MAVLMSALLPVWSHMATREKEEELIFRGKQYARAIGLFQRKFANTAPPTIDVLVEQRFLRKKYKDPITNDDFQPHLRQPGHAAAGSADRRPRQRPGQQRRATLSTPAQQAAAGRIRQHRRGVAGRRHRRDLEEQGRVDQDLQRPRRDTTSGRSSTFRRRSGRGSQAACRRRAGRGRPGQQGSRVRSACSRAPRRCPGRMAAQGPQAGLRVRSAESAADRAAESIPSAIRSNAVPTHRWPTFTPITPGQRRRRRAVTIASCNARRTS